MATRQSKTKQKKVKYGSDVIVDLMKAFDIEYAAFNPGATFRGIHDSILNYGENKCPEVIFCCHEEYSVAIAHGYAKAKGKPMAAITHDLVGLQHASMAIFNQENSSMLCIGVIRDRKRAVLFLVSFPKT